MSERSYRELIDELLGTVCRCGNPKGARKTFCGACYYRLPPPVRNALYRRIGEGYEDAYAQATALLGGGSADDGGEGR